MKEEEVQRILNVSGFTRGKMPFKYLGVPISHKRLGVKECMVLVEKMTARVRCWSSRNISYQGRLVLVNAVLLSIQVYWAQMFVLPKKVIHEIQMVCRAYLWTGNYFSSRGGYVAWEKVCRPKNAGGLGVRNLECWKRLLWGDLLGLGNQKRYLWIKWVNELYVKNENWWDYKPNQGCSWYWKKICEVKDELKGKLSEAVLQNMNEYSVKSIYTILTGEFTKIHWDKYVWERMIIPKHRFFLWLIQLDRLQTTKRLHDMGVATNDQCLICGMHVKTQKHLFFECNYSKTIFRRIAIWMGIQLSNMTMHSIIQWISRCSEPKFKKQVYAMVLGAVVYHIWRSRNDVYWSQYVSTVNNIVHRVQKDVIDRCYSVLPKKVSRVNRDWLRELAVNVCR
ncbi:uncharacterized protein LOC130591883 [Beta vulgaris subsp. vulgaris]|uniref:uncharacterized protein LOC130591883 n=1 Tax=Beta vulgaris subsp. vulgaris TaxID=3555 RepID=UPI002549A8EB|nr:uncharacterized protein LOC130591883 [Beta vulgaris subsp. vulgaris]